MIFSYLALAFALPVTYSQTVLRGCINQLTSSGLNYRLIWATTFSQYIQCQYSHDNGDGTTPQTYCWYDYQTYALDHAPNTPTGEDSNANCPTSLPLAQTYIIKTSQSGKCVTASGNYDGAPVVIKDCDYRHGNPGQRWSFNGALIQPFGTNKCLDVTDGNTANGVKLQVWTCFNGNTNQQFQHWLPTHVLAVPEDHISWVSHPFQCMDLTDGNLANGNPIQLWSCDYQNPNQKWFLDPSP